MSFPCPSAIHSKTPAPGLIFNYARSGWDLCLGQIILHLLLWEFHILFRNIWHWCLSQMGYWVRWKLRPHANMFPNLIIFKGAFKVTDPTFPSNISFQRVSASLQKGNSLMSHREALALSQAAFGSLSSSLPQPSSLRKPKLSLNQLNSRMDVLRAATSPNSVTGWSMAA